MDFRIITIDGEKPQYKVAGVIAGEPYVAGIFTEKKIAERIMWLCDMVVSDWCYGRKGLESEYVETDIKEAVEAGASKDFVKSIVLSLYDWLDNGFVAIYSGEDSEGVTYNRIVKKGEK